MAYLLDTHALIWFLEGDEQLSAKAKEIIADDNTGIYLSMASLWEMAIKISIGKLKISQSLEQVIETRAAKYFAVIDKYQTCADFVNVAV